MRRESRKFESCHPDIVESERNRAKSDVAFALFVLEQAGACSIFSINIIFEQNLRVKQILVLFVLSVVFFTGAAAQTERVTYCEDSNYDLSVSYAVVDHDGNTYLLVNKTPFDAGEGHDDPVTRSSDPLYLYKMDSLGKTLWMQLISDKCTGTGGIFIKNNAVYVAFRQMGGCVPKAADINGWSPPIAGGIECGMFINTDGKILSNKCFYEKMTLNADSPYYESDTCPEVGPNTVYVHKDGIISSLQYREVFVRDSVDTNYLGIFWRGLNPYFVDEKRDDTLGYIGNKATHFPISNRIKNYNSILYDEFDDLYIVCDSYRVNIYDTGWQMVRSINLPPAGNLKGYVCNLTCNSNYYVIQYNADSLFDVTTNCGFKAKNNYGVYRTFVYTKGGKQISFSESDYYGALKISDDNMIYAIPDRTRTIRYTFTSDYETLWKAIPPPSLLKMDIHQKILGEHPLGKHYSRNLSISITKKNKLMVTGTEVHPPSIEDNRPSGIYFYREKLE